MSGPSFVDTQGRSAAPAPAWRVLRIAAEIYADFQQFRIAAANRAERGGMPPEEFAGLIDGIEKQEARLKRYLRDAYRAAVPVQVRTWQGETAGLGEHTFARLLGLLGDPRVAHPWHWEGKGTAERVLVADPPYERSVSQLWSYCGVGDPTRKRRRGMDLDDALSCGSPRIRALMFVISEGCVKQLASPYRRVYDEAKAQYAERVHAEPCVRCGPSGKPAEAGSPWSKAHQHAAAMRKVAKEILRDLWLVAGEGASHTSEPMRPAPLPATSQDGEPAMVAAEPKGRSPAAVLAEAES